MERDGDRGRGRGGQRGRRLFFALWPPAVIADRILALPERFGIRGRVTRRERLHLTVLFLGDVPATAESNLVRGLPRSIPTGPVDLTLDTLGGFARAGVWWLGPSVVPRALNDLHATLVDAAAVAGIAVERRPFRPHVTLARRSRPGPETSVDAIRWRADELTLVASVDTGGRAAYRVCSRWPLG
ncbi:MAG TPA: RNA 2',3'-cyclic phosphodiesterase [Gammaproteobacteria bacterium]|nr:RNA 2',3'-cyclic phosphodiesterase [Gammaproteobacteria bacterium]